MPATKTSFCLVATLLVGTLTTGCNRCDNDYPPSSALLFSVTSATGQNLLGRLPAPYHPDSLRLTYRGQPFGFEVLHRAASPEGPVVRIHPTGFDGQSDAQVLVQLNKTDTDTISITYRIDQGQCFDVVRYNSVFYNGTRMGQDGNGLYKFVKR